MVIRRSERQWPAALAVGLMCAGSQDAGAAPEPEREDNHVRPASFESWTAPSPPPQMAEAEYPLAFWDPACDCNYSANGMTSYDHIVVHTMQGSYAGSISWFKNPDAQVSAHYCMRSVDGEVTQMVLHKDKAWHVGSSNPTSIGIEHEGFVADPNKWYTWETYVSSARLARWIATRHDIPLTREHILGHVELPNQTHTDPGPGWNWDMYMGLISDVVPQGEIHAVVVDRSELCTLTATVDTYLRRTAEPLELLEVDELCPIGAGATITYMHASAPIAGRRRLLMEPGQGGCQAGLDEVAFIDETQFSALCDPAAMAAVGASVSLDGGAPMPVGPDGVLLLPPIAAGQHTLDVTAPGVYEPASEGVDLAVYPGVRVAIAVDPVPDEPPPPDTTSGGETGGGETSAADTGGGGSGDVTGDPPTTGQGSDPSAGSGPGSGSSSGEELDPPGLSGVPFPDGYGLNDGEGCGCRSRAGEGGLLALLGVVGLARRRRRR